MLICKHIIYWKYCSVLTENVLMFIKPGVKSPRQCCHSMISILLVSFFLCCSSLFYGCAYYNYFYNAKRYYKEGEKQRKETTDDNGKQAQRGSSNYDKCIESAGRMLEYYPNSRWEDDVLLLLAKAYYRAENYRKAISKIDELIAKYPKSKFVREGMLWKGVSLLKVSQPDSGKLVLSGIFETETHVELQAQAYQALGEYYYDKEEWEQARREFRKVLNLGFDDEWLRGIAWVRIGECLSQLQRMEDAVELYDEILAGKPPRQLKLEATLQRAEVLRMLGRTEEVITPLEELLNDAAYINDFPRIEMEVARCLRILSRYEEAKKRLEILTETEKRGELAAESQYEMGWLLWEIWRDLAGAHRALKEVKSADRSSPYVETADSLREEMEALYSSWQWIGFLEKQLLFADSSKRGLKSLTFSDTIFTDSLKILTQDDKKEKSRRERRSRKKDRDQPKRIEDKKDGESSDSSDSTATEADTVATGLDSTALADLLVKRSEELATARMELAGYHLFKRNDEDSAAYYFRILIDREDAGDRWARAIASLAYINKLRGDTTSNDSLYRLILERMSEGSFVDYAKDALGYDTIEEETDSLQVMLDKAESLWLDKDDPIASRELYLKVVDLCDSASVIRPRALLAAAYISRKVISDDSVALVLYKTIAEDYAQSEFGRLAKKRSDLDRIAELDGESINKEVPFDDSGKRRSGFPEDLTDDDITLISESEQEPEKVYNPEDVDILPKLITSPKKLKTFLRIYYPDQVSSSELMNRVEIEFVVRKNSEITDITILESEPTGQGFEEAAKMVMNKLKYKAGRREGRKVPVLMKQILVFEKEEAKEEEGVD